MSSREAAGVRHLADLQDGAEGCRIPEGQSRQNSEHGLENERVEKLNHLFPGSTTNAAKTHTYLLRKGWRH